MKWSELKKMVDGVLEKEEPENKDPDIATIDISVGMMMLANPEIIIHVENGELEIF